MGFFDDEAMGSFLHRKCILVRCYGICPNCGYKVNMIRYMGGYIPYTRASLIILRGELKEKIKNERPLGKNPMDKNNG